MSTTATGQEAEEKVAAALQTRGHKIVARNWRTRWCEIDIVSRKKQTMYFTEVKYRSSSDWGDGLDYITPKKLQQMQFAAELWLQEHDWQGESMLQAASVDADYSIEFVEIS